MKSLILIMGLTVLSACVTTQEFDQEAAFKRCEAIEQKTSRDRCLSDAVADARRDRLREAERTAQREADAEARELERARYGGDPD
ncbi:MAG: hypothetical protein AAGH90_09670 [Pseudomonadota bacterium]